jgi:exosortase
MADVNADAPEPGAPATGSLARTGVRVASVLLALVAYRELLWFQPERALPEELERWFFVPSTTITPVVLACSLWLLYRRKERLAALPARSGGPGIGAALLAAGTAVYAWATYTGAGDLLVPSLMLNGLGCAWLWKGRAAARAVWLPVAFLVFAMPLPAPALNSLIFRLQIATSEIAGALLYLLDVPHFVAGERILRAEATFSVIEACSGLRSMETLVIVSILMMDMFRRRGWHAVVVVLAAFPVAFFLNGLRAVLLILNPHSEIAAIHNLQGIAILLGGLVLLFLLDGLLERFGSEPVAPVPAPHSEPGPGPGGGSAGSWAVAGTAALLVVISVALPRWDPGPTPSLDLSRTLASGLGAYLSRTLDTDLLFLGSAGFSEVFTRRFEGDGERVELFVGRGNRAQRHRSALSPKTAIPGSGWIIEEEGTVVLEPDGREVRSRVLRKGSQRYLVYDWVEGSHGWASEVIRSLLALDRSPLRDPGEIVSLRMSVEIQEPISTGRAKAEAEILRFYRMLRPQLDDALSET